MLDGFYASLKTLHLIYGSTDVYKETVHQMETCTQTLTGFTETTTSVASLLTALCKMVETKMAERRIQRLTDEENDGREAVSHSRRCHHC